MKRLTPGGDAAPAWTGKFPDGIFISKESIDDIKISNMNRAIFTPVFKMLC
jgi:hypothetical protein